MAEIWTRQQQLQRSLDRFLENFKKLGRANLTAAKIRSRISALRELWQQFQSGNAVLLQSTPATQQESVDYFSGQCFDQTEEIYRSTLDHLTEALEELEPPVSPHNDSNAGQQQRATSVSLAQLPPICLPPFDGQALSCINNLPVTAANFDIAWQVLVSRYENKGRLLQLHLSALLNLPTVTRESAVELQTLRDRVKTAVASLIHLPRSPSDLWSDILVHLVVQRLDSSSRKAWSLKVADHAEPPSFNDLDRFLASRARAFDELACAASSKACARSGSTCQISAATVSAVTNPQCPICKSRHFFSACPSFVRGTPTQRRELVKKHGRCFNCLSHSHSVQNCTSKYSCRSCHQRHHSLLHSSSSTAAKFETENCTGQSTPSDGSRAAVQSLLASRNKRASSQILLATAQVKVSGVDGRSSDVRALLDQGSEMSFISEHLAQSLRLKRSRLTSVSAVGCVSAGTFRHAACILVSPRSSPSPTVSATALILPSLTSFSPRHVAELASISHLSSLSLADPDPTGDDPIHLILGADVYGAIIRDGVLKGNRNQPVAQNSIFGWVISGPTPTLRAASASRSSRPSSRSEISISSLHCFLSPSLEESVQRFWEVEEVPRLAIASPEDEECEAHFLATHSRTATGRYIVRLPFKSERPVALGDSRRLAERQLHAIFRRLQRQPDLLAEYRAFVNEYARLNHLQLAPATSDSQSCVYLPHHPVFRNSSLTSRVRVVFNASSPTSTGSSLNDQLMTGPKLQADLTAVLLRWRQFRCVCSADIAKMYRQILLNSHDLDFQRMLWKETIDGSVVAYRLLTVTYGLACAPFLALRVLRQLALDEGESYPRAASIIRDHIYVDDVLFGHDHEKELRTIRDQLTLLLRRGGRTLSESDVVNVLGLEWSPKPDAFQIRVSLLPASQETKREILAAIAKLYDPLGLLTPVILAAKLVMQQFLPWWTGYSDHGVAELHGFADASNGAYAAVVYLRFIDAAGSVTVTLLQGKSKVAPLKPVTIPRLELMAAVLLSHLIDSIRSFIRIESIACTCWSDSTVVLSWLRHHPSRWKTFIANRVSDIQGRLRGVEWRHVITSDNPADCASRGLLGSELVSHQLWWRGPPWLSLSRDQWPS
ncbi:uncharacterized protein LOC116846716 [Odontomachus brunneus]|uniref:uncharacterized protein LOC116846716 n=1 Tax=Odontomachus brunneus TaxID=486640 RepID=UPI0013F18EFA|nr:uncharacterized protein LOC116846716 [Odontomachus brunneus]